jgi:WD40-like Beta Propeller Repeat
VVLYEMTTGTQPFKGATPAAIFNAILNHQPAAVRALNQALPAKLEEIIYKTLEKKREFRCQSAAELNADLRRLKRELESGNKHHEHRRGACSVRGGFAPMARARRHSRHTVRSAPAAQHLAPGLAPSLAAIKLVQVTTAEGLHGFPTWSPDGRRIAYSREVNGFKKVFIKPLDAEPQQITGNFDDIQPRFTPNGDAILFVRSNQHSGKLEPGDVFGKYDAGDIWKKDLASDTEESSSKMLSTLRSLPTES